MWMAVQETMVNTVNQQRNMVDCRDVEWIRAMLSYLQDKAAIWESSAMEEFVTSAKHQNA